MHQSYFLWKCLFLREFSHLNSEVDGTVFRMAVVHRNINIRRLLSLPDVAVKNEINAVLKCGSIKRHRVKVRSFLNRPSSYLSDSSALELALLLRIKNVFIKVIKTRFVENSVVGWIILKWSCVLKHLHLVWWYKEGLQHITGDISERVMMPLYIWTRFGLVVQVDLQLRLGWHVQEKKMIP